MLIFLLLFAGFAIKVPLFPFHTWLPLAHVEAPTAGSILLAGRDAQGRQLRLPPVQPGDDPARRRRPSSRSWRPSRSIGILYGALAALAQTDVKRLVAYSSVSHMGFIVLGLFSLNATGIDGAMIQMLNHGLTTGRPVRLRRRDLRAVSHPRDGASWAASGTGLPLWAFFIILASLGSAAVPGLNGFVGEFPILLGMFRTQPDLSRVLAALGMILGAYYLLWMLQRVVFGPLRSRRVHGHDARCRRPRPRPRPRPAIRAGRLARDRRPDAPDGPDRPDRRLSQAVPRPDPAAAGADRGRVPDETEPGGDRTPPVDSPSRPARGRPGARTSRPRPPATASPDRDRRPSNRDRPTTEVRPPMTAIESARQTLLILLPELLILLAATAMMTAGAFVRCPRRTWAIASAVTLVVAPCWRWSCSDDQVDRPLRLGRPRTTRCRATPGWSSC